MLSHDAPRRAALLRLAAAIVVPVAARAADALPRRDLVVELRTRGGGLAGASAWDVGSADAARERAVASRVRVGNGRSASLHLATTRPVQTWQALPGVWRGVAAPATQWIRADRALVVEPRWPGGTRPVTVTLRASAARFDATVAPGSAAPPEVGEAGLVTTVETTLGAWITIATSGDVRAADEHVVGTRDASSTVLQLRVSLAP